MFTPPPRQIPPPFIIEDALAGLEGNLPLLKTVVQMVIDQSAADMAAIRSDAAANNSTALVASSHRLKGSLGAVAAMSAYQACSGLNRLARIDATESYAMGLAHLEEELGQLLPFLKAWLADKPMN
jgi:HPt (histidine-containing phosphotransfer) domain-containing protein